MPVAGHPDVNGIAFCDCGATKFFVGLEVRPNGDNFIKLLECVECDLQMRVPFKEVNIVRRTDWLLPK